MTKQLKVENLPAGIKAERLRFFFMNKKKCGGGPIKDIALHEESGSAVITFQESDGMFLCIKYMCFKEFDLAHYCSIGSHKNVLSFSWPQN